MEEIILAQKEIMDKLDAMDSKLSRVDLSITGDPERGVLGMKQHVQKLQVDFHDHTISDAQQFVKLEKIKGWLAGALFVATAAVSGVVIFVNVYIKTVK